MSTIQMQTEIGKMLHSVDDRILSAVYSMLADYLRHDQTIIGFSTDGTPMTKADLLQMVEKSRLEGVSGKTRSVENILEEVETW